VAEGKGIVILGAGLTGLSCARHLQAGGILARVIEKESRVGGVACTDLVEGFHFDHAGHLLHLRTEYGRALVEKLFPEHPFQELKREARIYSKGVYTDYPFQANTHGLPVEVVRECLMGFVEALRRDEERRPDDSFASWVRKTFGSGIARHFMTPFNEKMWRCDLEEVTTDWVSWSIPRPGLQEVVNGALGVQEREFGYNPRFLYPKEGGIEILARRLSEGVEVRLGMPAAGVDLEERELRFADGTSEPYEHLVNTAPLSAFLSLCGGLPDDIREAADGLRFVDVHVFNMGVRGEAPLDAHWVYVPEPEIPFYRVGVATNFAPATAPPDHYSLYVETSRRPDEPVDLDALRKDVHTGLVGMGVIEDPADIVVEHHVRIRPAYVVHDVHRREALPDLLAFLSEKGVLSVGRYGAWEYSSMEDALLQGRDAAAKVLGQEASLID
jgi:protoporphyrinogen oxidase